MSRVLRPVLRVLRPGGSRTGLAGLSQPLACARLSPATPSFGGASRGLHSFYGPVQQHIEAKVAEALGPEHLEVTNESHGKPSDESHFHVLVVSKAFEGVRPVGRHRLVSQLFTDEKGALKFHSLRITAKTPEQWSIDSTSPQAPKCTGKGDGRAPTDVGAL
eukprot:TRINITY_DN26977_c0_g1_i1.p1 TRINITY_DN26977_c0_g1~~TRINITY_DN26977_c0_g1_i1.p1  ORF type:complete len:162 (+),score=22.57 TRINITY_DN26977_c0_g1_i1:106-591(+)